MFELSLSIKGLCSNMFLHVFTLLFSLDIGYNASFCLILSTPPFQATFLDMRKDGLLEPPGCLLILLVLWSV